MRCPPREGGRNRRQWQVSTGRGKATLTGTAGGVGATTITINYGDLNAMTGVYGANPPDSVNGGTPTAQIRSWRSTIFASPSSP